MTAALGEALLIASAGMLSIGQILLVLMLLSGEQGLKKAGAYALGMFTSLLCIGQGALLVGSRFQQVSAPSSGPGMTAWLSIILGVFLLGMALRNWRSPPDPEAAPSKLFDRLDSTTALRMLGFGALVGVINVKNLAIYLSAVDVIVSARLPHEEGMVAVVAITLVFLSYLISTIGLATLGGRWVKPLLVKLRLWLVGHQRSLTIGVLLLFGTLFLIRGLKLFL